MIANNSHKCNKLFIIYWVSLILLFHISYFHISKIAYCLYTFRKSSSSFTQTPVTSQVAIITQKIGNNMEYMEYILFLFVFYINMEQEWGQQ